jgi:hypothetical protein
MGQFASARPTLHVPARKAGAFLLWNQPMASGRIRPVPFIVAAA